MNGWELRFKNFSAALQLLQHAVTECSDLEKLGAIHRFTYCHELAWQVMKDYLTHEGIVGLIGSRGATREAFSKGLIMDGPVWMKMLESRNRTVHTYVADILETEYRLITELYYPLLADFGQKMKNYL